MTTQHLRPRLRSSLLPSIFAVLVLLIPATLRAQISLASTQLQLPTGALAQPSGIAVDAAGDVFISDTGNQRILMLPAAGSSYGQATVIASGLGAPGALAIDAAGNLFFADTLNNTVSLLPFTNPGYGPPAVLASGLNTPTGLAIDAFDSLLVSDNATGRILYFQNSPSGYAAPTTIVSGLQNPQGLFVDGNRNLYFADSATMWIQRVPWSGNGYGAPAKWGVTLKSPSSVVLDAKLNLYAVSAATHTLTYCAWNAGPKRYDNCSTPSVNFASPAAIGLDSAHNMYVADPASGEAIVVTTGSLSFPAADLGSASLSLAYNFNITAGTTIGAVVVDNPVVGIPEFSLNPHSTCSPGTYPSAASCSVALSFTPAAPGLRQGAVEVQDPSGNPLIALFISGLGNGAIPFFTDAAKSYLGTGLASPSGVSVDNSGNLFISDTGNNRVVEIPSQNGIYQPQVSLSIAGLVEPLGLHVDATGTMYVTSSGNDAVLQIPNVAQGSPNPTTLQAGYTGPSDVTLDRWGNLYVASTYSRAIIRSHWNGTYFDKLTSAAIVFPVSLSIDASDFLYSVNPYISSFVRIPDSLTYTNRIADNSQALGWMASPTAIAADAFGNVFLLDSHSNQLILYPQVNGTYGAPLVLDSDLNSPSAITLDALGNIYVADTGNNRIVKIFPSIPDTLSFQPTFLSQTSTDSPNPIALVNLGNEPLTLNSLTFPPDFPQQSAPSACAPGAILAPSTACAISPAFAPTQAGSPLQESISLSESGPGLLSPSQTISLSGTTLAQLSQTITVQPIPNVQYGVAPIPLSATASSGLPVRFSVLSGPGTLAAHGTQLLVTGAGLISLQATQAGNKYYAASQPTTFTVTVSPAQLTVSATDLSTLYGSLPQAFPYTISGYVNNDTGSNAYQGRPLLTTTAQANSPIGTYPITASQGTLLSSKYTFLFAPANLTITPAPLTITAQPGTTTYGHIPPPFKYTISGLIRGDTASALGGTPYLATLATPASPVGTYPILVFGGNLVNSNYNITLVPSTLTITPSVLTVTAASPAISYGAPLPALTYTIAGFVNSEVAQSSITGAPVLATTALAQSTPGVYSISINPGTLAASNYTFTCLPGTLTIQKAPLTVVPTALSLVYGSTPPALTYSLTGFVFNDTPATVSGVPALSTVVFAGSSVGSYPITASIGSLASANYSFVFAPASITVTPAQLLVSANPASSTYGANPPNLTYTITGYLLRDTRASIVGNPALATPANCSSPVGSYPITPSPGTLAAKNYTFLFQPSTLTVTPAVLTVTAGNLTTQYGAPVPAFPYTFAGFLNGDTPQNALTGSPALSTTAVAQSTPGSYPIQISAGSLAAANYTFAFRPATLVIAKATLTVTPAATSMVYGSTVPNLAYTFSGFAFGDSAANSITGTPLLRTSAPTYAAVGTYTITATIGSLASPNYAFTFAPGVLTITPAQLLVTANAASATYGANPPNLTYNITGYVNRDSRANIPGAPSLTATLTGPVGSAPIVASQGTLAAANYTFAFAPGVLTITPASLTLSADNQTMVQGAALPPLTFTAHGLVNGDSLATAITGAPVLSTTATATSAPGTYPISIAAGSTASANYTVSFVSGTLTVNQSTSAHHTPRRIILLTGS